MIGKSMANRRLPALRATHSRYPWRRTGHTSRKLSRFSRPATLSPLLAVGRLGTNRNCSWGLRDICQSESLWRIYRGSDNNLGSPDLAHRLSPWVSTRPATGLATRGVWCSTGRCTWRWRPARRASCWRGCRSRWPGATLTFHTAIPHYHSALSFHTVIDYNNCVVL